MYHFCPIRWTKKKEMGKGMMTRDLSCPPSRGKMNLYHLPGGQFGNAHRNFNVLSLRPRKSTWENLKYSDEFKSMQIHGYNKNSNKKEKHLSRHQRWCWRWSIHTRERCAATAVRAAVEKRPRCPKWKKEVVATVAQLCNFAVTLCIYSGWTLWRFMLPYGCCKKRSWLQNTMFSMDLSFVWNTHSLTLPGRTHFPAVIMVARGNGGDFPLYSALYFSEFLSMNFNNQGERSCFKHAI